MSVVPARRFGYPVWMIDASRRFADRFTTCRPTSMSANDACSPASEARAAGYGGIAAVAAATGIAASTIGRGLKELASASG